jgi:tetraacyldisaccharide 4'-kinase
VEARLLAPLSLLWQTAGWLRRSLARPYRAAAPVICIGNLVLGGAGKTPTALAIARRLRARGIAAHLLSRGYGGTLAGPVRVDPARHTAAEVGDEPLLLAAAGPTWVARRRRQGAAAAVQAGAAALILDDGHQNPSLEKDLSIVVVDSETAFGNGRVVPAGPLREPVAEGLARADALVLVGGPDDAVTPAPGRPDLPVFRARLEPAGETAASLKGRSVVAFAGIGRPAKFFASLRAIGGRVVATHAFPDHHLYGPDEIMRLVEQASAAEAVLVTTAKDYVRLPVEAKPMVEVLQVELRFADPDAVDRLLATVCP